MTGSPATGRVRTAEIIAAVCLATDLGMGFPLEHGFAATLMAMRLCDLLGVDSDTASETYYASMLTYTGCTTDAARGAEIFAGPQTENVVPVLWGSLAERVTGLLRALPPPGAGQVRRTVEMARRFPKLVLGGKEHQTALCEVGEMLARRLGVPNRVSDAFAYLTERWDGQSVLRRASGEEIPQSLRIALLARDAAFQQLVGGEEHAVETIKRRSGAGHDPNVADVFLANARDVVTIADGPAWEAVLDAEPVPHLYLEDAAVDRALSGMGDFADLIAPSFTGHSSGVAALVGTSAALAGFTDAEIQVARRAAMVHDVGRVGIDVRVWEKPGTLSVHDREQIRLHPYLTERVLAPSPFLSQVADVACDHHERLDGSGYHRGVPAQLLSRPARLVAVADAFTAMAEPRPHRPPLDRTEIVRRITAEATAGRLDPEMVAAVMEAVGSPVPELPSPAGLTAREAEVVSLLARGLQTKQIARRLEISPKTADSHIQNAYRKIGASTRAAATLFAMEHGLVTSGEFPISD